MFSVILFCRGEPLFDEFKFPGRRGDALLGFLLKGVKHVNRIAKADCIDRTVGVAFIRRHDLKHATPATPAKPFERFDGRIFFAALCRVKSLAYVALN
jgi:hypothetical protein